MSLKAFHIIFISLSALIITGFGIWLIIQSNAEGRGILMIAAVAAFIAVIFLVWYGIKFLKKLKNVSFL